MPGEVKHVAVEWAGGLRFRGGEADRPTITVDGDGVEAPGPMAGLLVMLAACTGADVVEILGKMRAMPASIRIEVHGTRREDYPRRYTDVHLTFVLEGGAYVSREQQLERAQREAEADVARHAREKAKLEVEQQKVALEREKLELEREAQRAEREAEDKPVVSSSAGALVYGGTYGHYWHDRAHDHDRPRHRSRAPRKKPDEAAGTN